MSESAPILGEKRRISGGYTSTYPSLLPPDSVEMSTTSLLPDKTSPVHVRSVNSPETDIPLSPPLRKTPRMVKRSDGRSLVRYRIPPQSYLSYLRDFFTSIINAQWYIIIPFFFACYIVSWLIFGCAWTALAYSFPNENMTCVYNVQDFKSAFLFSIETQLTIGYGFRYPSDACGAGITLLAFQSVVGLLIDSFLLGLMFAKLTRPRNRRKTIFFSNTAVIYDQIVRKVERNEEGRPVEKTQRQRVLELRIADVRRSQVVEAHVRLQLYWYRDSPGGGGGEGELRQYDLDVGYEEGRDRIFLLTPVSVFHYITEKSPLYGLTREDLATSQLELVVVLEGIVEATGLTAQVLWSYTRDEIVFDSVFQPVAYYSETGREWVVDFSKLSSLKPLTE